METHTIPNDALTLPRPSLEDATALLARIQRDLTGTFAFTAHDDGYGLEEEDDDDVVLAPLPPPSEDQVEWRLLREQPVVGDGQQQRRAYFSRYADTVLMEVTILATFAPNSDRLVSPELLVGVQAVDPKDDTLFAVAYARIRTDADWDAFVANELFHACVVADDEAYTALQKTDHEENES